MASTVHRGTGPSQSRFRACQNIARRRVPRGAKWRPVDIGHDVVAILHETEAHIQLIDAKRADTLVPARTLVPSYGPQLFGVLPEFAVGPHKVMLLNGVCACTSRLIREPAPTPTIAVAPACRLLEVAEVVTPIWSCT